MAFDSSFDAKEQVRQAIDIVDLLGKYNLQLRRQGRGYVTHCPWHDDTRPSLQVNPERQSWKCWPCDIGGDIFSFVMKMEGVDFPEALAMLADRAGIKLQKPARGEPAHRRGSVRRARWHRQANALQGGRLGRTPVSRVPAPLARGRAGQKVLSRARHHGREYRAVPTRLRAAGSRLDPQAGRRKSQPGPRSWRRSACSAALPRAAASTTCSAAADCSPFTMPKAGPSAWAAGCYPASRAFFPGKYVNSPETPAVPQEPSALRPRSGQGGHPQEQDQDRAGDGGLYRRHHRPPVRLQQRRGRAGRGLGRNPYQDPEAFRRPHHPRA